MINHWAYLHTMVNVTIADKMYYLSEKSLNEHSCEYMFNFPSCIFQIMYNGCLERQGFALTVVRTFIMVSMCHLLFGEYLKTQCKIIVNKAIMTLSTCTIIWQRGVSFDAGRSSYFSAAKKISEVTYDLNSKSALTRKVSSSFIMPRMLLEFTRAKDNSMARLKLNYRRMWCNAQRLCNCVLTEYIKVRLSASDNEICQRHLPQFMSLKTEKNVTDNQPLAFFLLHMQSRWTVSQNPTG